MTRTYDALNRLTGTSYNDGVTPSVSYLYGAPNNGVANSADQLMQVNNTTSITNYTSFDAMGRVTASNQVTGGQTYAFNHYVYNLAGTLTSETYPSGRVVTTSYDGANRFAGVSGALNGVTTPYVSNVSYWPHGAILGLNRANSLSLRAAVYNSRLQPVESYEFLDNNYTSQFLDLTCLDWGTQPVSSDCTSHFSAAADNGTLRNKYEYAGGPGPWSALPSYTHTYSYDNLNRLTQDSDGANGNGASRTMTYDQWGNMASTGAIFSELTPYSTALFNASNRLTSSSFNYDNAGNMICWAALASATMPRTGRSPPTTACCMCR